MSFVKPDRSTENTTRAAALLEEHEQFCAEVADGLHTLAQPLTILRSAIAMLAMRKDCGNESERYVDMSVRQIERTCQLFSSVQNLLAAKTVPADRKEIDLRDLFAPIVEEHLQMLHERGIGLIVDMSESEDAVFADPQRTRLAIATAFATAISASAAGDVIKVDSSASEGLFEISIESTCRPDNSLKSFERLNLSLVRANIQSQQGQYLFTQEPFRISLALPAHQHGSADNETVGCTAYVA